MKKYFVITMLLFATMTISSCGLFGGSKSEKCPAYSAVPSADQSSDLSQADSDQKSQNN